MDGNYNILERVGLLPSEKVMRLIIANVLKMDNSGAESAKIRLDDCEGRISTERKYFSIGLIRGTVFDVTLETSHGRTELKLLIDIPGLKKLIATKKPITIAVMDDGDSFPEWAVNTSSTVH